MPKDGIEITESVSTDQKFVRFSHFFVYIPVCLINTHISCYGSVTKSVSSHHEWYKNPVTLLIKVLQQNEQVPVNPLIKIFN